MKSELAEQVKEKMMKAVRFGGNYAIGDVWGFCECKLLFFNEMDEKGYELVAINDCSAVFKKRGRK